MDNSSLNATEIAVGSLLAGGGGVGGVGRGAWDRGGTIATPWSVQDVNDTINGQADCINGNLEGLARTLSFDAVTKTVTDGNTRLCDKSEANAVRNSDQLFALSRDIDNKFAIVTNQNHQAALSAKDSEIRNVERFCKLESGQATIIAKIDANKEYGELFAENQSLKTQIACGCVTGCSTPCNSHGHHGGRG